MMIYIIHIILGIVFWSLGIFIGSFGLGNIFIVLGFGIPYTRDLERQNQLVQNHGIIYRYLITLIIWIVIISAVSLTIYNFVPQYFIIYLASVIITVFRGIKQFGRNKNNISDYVELNKIYFKIKDDDLIETLMMAEHLRQQNKIFRKLH